MRRGGSRPRISGGSQSQAEIAGSSVEVHRSAMHRHGSGLLGGHRVTGAGNNVALRGARGNHMYFKRNRGDSVTSARS